MAPKNAKAAPADPVGGSHCAQLGGECGEPNKSAPGPQVIGTLEKNSRESIRVALDSYRGSDFLDIRIFANYGPDDLRPTRQGCTIRPALIPELRELLEAAEGEARRRGLLT